MTIKLPTHAEIIDRLNQVEVKNYHGPSLKQELYPQIAQLSGQKFAPADLVTSLVMKISYFVFDGERRDQFPPGSFRSLFANIPRFINALVDDPKLAQKACNIVSDD